MDDIYTLVFFGAQGLYDAVTREEKIDTALLEKIMEVQRYCVKKRKVDPDYLHKRGYLDYAEAP